MSELLEPVDEASPCGPDLEYDEAFLELDRAAAGKPEREQGGVVAPAQPPDWKTVHERSIELFGRTKDLRVAVHLAHALAQLDGLSGFVDGLRTVRGLMERYWDGLHPQLDASDGDDPTMRMNALIALVHLDTGQRVLRGAIWLRATGVRVSVRQALGALGLEPPSSDGQPDEEQLDAMVRATAASDATNHARAALGELRAIGALLDERVGAATSPDFAPLRRMLAPLADRFDRVVGVPGDAEPSAATDVDAAGGSGDAPSGMGRPSGPIRSRDDAARALDAVCTYLERAEPANPAPLLIRRAQRLMSMDFLDIMRELAPDALPAVQHIAGAPRTDE